MVAMGAEHYLNGSRNDPRYIQWVAVIAISTPDSYEEVFHPMYPCTDAQFAKLDSVDSKNEAKVQKLKADNNFYCFDWGTSGVDLYGSFTTGSTYQSLDLMFIPCAS